MTGLIKRWVLGDEDEIKYDKKVTTFAADELENGLKYVDRTLLESDPELPPTIFGEYFIAESVSAGHGAVIIDKGLNSYVIVPWDSHLRKFSDIIFYKSLSTMEFENMVSSRASTTIVGPTTDSSMLALYSLQSASRRDKESISYMKDKNIFNEEQCTKWKDASRFMGFRHICQIPIEHYNLFAGFNCIILQDLMWERIIDIWLGTPRSYGFIYKYTHGDPFLGFDLFVQSIMIRPIPVTVISPTDRESDSFTVIDYYNNVTDSKAGSSKKEKAKSMADGITMEEKRDLMHFDWTLASMRKIRDKYLPHIARMNKLLNDITMQASIVTEEYNAERKSFASGDKIAISREKLEKLNRSITEYQTVYGSILEHVLLRKEEK